MNKSINISLFLIAVIAVSSVTTASHAQEKKKPAFNVQKFLKRLDVNQNGKVEPSEIPDDRTRGFLEKSGVDPSKPISIKNFAKQIKKQRSDRKKPSSSQKTLGFAVDSSDRENAEGTTSGFAVSEEERKPAERARTRKFSEGAKKMLSWAMKNYDTNNDGKIDKNEIKAGRWSDPPAEESDTNKDGSLSRTELLERYEKRENRREKKSKNRSKRGGFAKSKAPSKKSKSRSNVASSDVRKGYENYVDGLFKSYDKNKDGVLDSEEIDGMRRKPAADADQNKDKKISKSELIESYLKKTGAAGKTKGNSNSKHSNRQRSGKSSSFAGSPSVRAPLTSKDTNRNGQIEMSEFAKTWTIETVEKFYKKDVNKDGVITSKEWNGE